MKVLLNIAALALVVLSSGCARILQDQVGVKRRFGKMEENILKPGIVGFNPITTRVFRVPIRTVNMEMNMDLPSKEGLTVSSSVSILYRIRPEAVPQVFRETGLNYERMLINPVFRSSAADICAKFPAKDMHSSKRSEIEREIMKRMDEICGPKGFVIESVLLKSIQLPNGLSRAIEAKLEAEQDAQRMEFVLDRQKREAQRQIIDAEGAKEIARIQAEGRKQAQIIEAEARRASQEIEAEGTKKANDLISGSLTPNMLRFKQIEAFMKLSTSPNTKTIITDGKTSMMNMLEDKQ